MPRKKVSGGVVAFFIAIGVLAVGATVFAESSNQNAVRARLSDDGFVVFYGEMITEREYAELTAAIATGNPKAVRDVLDEYTARCIEKAADQLGGDAGAELRDRLVKALLNGKNIRTTLKGADVGIGLVTYDRWDTLIYDEPRTREVWWKAGPIKTKGFETSMERVKKPVNLPNWHQPYIRIRVGG